jgi:peptidase A4-like protein
MKKILSLVALVMLLSIATGPATAAAQTPPVIHGLRLHTHLRNGTSTNWSGYAIATSLTAPASNAVSNVSGSWVVPAVSCPARATSYSSGWVGLDGYNDNTVEQTGTEQDCQRGRAQYYAWYEFYPQSEIFINTLAVHPGDSMSGAVSYADNNTFTLTLSDKTTGKTFTVSRRMANALRQSAEWIAEAPSSWTGVLPLANFGAMNFTNSTATVNGHTGTITDSVWQSDPLTMVAAGGQPKALLTPLSADGGSFGVSWQHN